MAQQALPHPRTKSSLLASRVSAYTREVLLKAHRPPENRPGLTRKGYEKEEGQLQDQQVPDQQAPAGDQVPLHFPTNARNNAASNGYGGSSFI